MLVKLKKGSEEVESLKLADFGVATICNKDESVVSATMMTHEEFASRVSDGTVALTTAGTPEYFPPEVHQSNSYNPRFFDGKGFLFLFPICICIQ